MKNYILQIESATFDGSVALSKNGETIERLWLGDGEKHIATMAPAVQKLLNNNNLKPFNLAAIAVSEGPGSYTGLRIGVSFAKGLATALSIPIIAIPTLDIISIAIKTKYVAIAYAVPLLDARRMEVYTTKCTDGILQNAAESIIIDEHSFAALRGKNTVFAGNGSAKCQGILVDEKWLIDTEIKLDAVFMSQIACRMFNDAQFVDTVNFEPFYLKEFMVGKASNKIWEILQG